MVTGHSPTRGEVQQGRLPVSRADRFFRLGPAFAAIVLAAALVGLHHTQGHHPADATSTTTDKNRLAVVTAQTAPAADKTHKPTTQDKNQPKTSPEEFWLEQVDAWGIAAPLALGLLLWFLGLTIIGVQAISAARERSRVAAENETTKGLLEKVATQLSTLDKKKQSDAG